jgi:hypothetical protein
VTEDEGRIYSWPKFKISCVSTERIASLCMKFLISLHNLKRCEYRHRSGGWYGAYRCAIGWSVKEQLQVAFDAR